MNNKHFGDTYSVPTVYVMSRPLATVLCCLNHCQSHPTDHHQLRSLARDIWYPGEVIQKAWCHKATEPQTAQAWWFSPGIFVWLVCRGELEILTIIETSRGSDEVDDRASAGVFVLATGMPKNARTERETPLSATSRSCRNETTMISGCWTRLINYSKAK